MLLRIPKKFFFCILCIPNNDASSAGAWGQTSWVGVGSRVRPAGARNGVPTGTSGGPPTSLLHRTSVGDRSAGYHAHGGRSRVRPPPQALSQPRSAWVEWGPAPECAV